MPWCQELFSWGLSSKLSTWIVITQETDIIWPEVICYHTLFLLFPMRGELVYKGLRG